LTDFRGSSLIRFTYSSISFLLVMELTIMIHSSQSDDLTSTTVVLLEMKTDIFSSSYEVKMKTKTINQKSLNKWKFLDANRAHNSCALSIERMYCCCLLILGEKISPFYSWSFFI
jgi:hypothetical protein